MPKATTDPEQTQTLFPPNMFWTMRHPSHLTLQERTFQNKCQELNPTYRVRSYDDASARQFISAYFPHYLDLYDNFSKPVMRADMWRYLILYQYGGVYFDLDVECLTPIDTWGDVAMEKDVLEWTLIIKVW